MTLPDHITRVDPRIMTRTYGGNAVPDRSAPRVGRLTRWRLTEPLRLYVYGWSLLLLLAACLAGAAAGFWQGPAIVVLVALLEVPAVEAARASVYSPRTVVQTAIRARHQ